MGEITTSYIDGLPRRHVRQAATDLGCIPRSSSRTGRPDGDAHPGQAALRSRVEDGKPKCERRGGFRLVYMVSWRRPVRAATGA